MLNLSLKIPPLLIMLLFAGLMLLTTWVCADFTVMPLIPILIMVIVLFAIFFILAGVFAFRNAKTTVNPMAPKLASTLVVAGIYRVTRNPMYLGFLCLLIAWGLYLSNVVALFWPILFILYMNIFQIIPEENVLSAKFNQAFSAYKTQVSRWLFF